MENNNNNNFSTENNPTPENNQQYAQTPPPPPQNQWSAPDNNQWNQPPIPGGDKKNLAVAALVCGIVGMVGGWFPIIQYFSGLAAIAAIILGAMAMKAIPKGVPGRGFAVAGLVLGIIAVGITIIVICVAVCAAAAILGTAGGLSGLY